MNNRSAAIFVTILLIFLFIFPGMALICVGLASAVGWALGVNVLNSNPSAYPAYILGGFCGGIFLIVAAIIAIYFLLRHRNTTPPWDITKPVRPAGPDEPPSPPTPARETLQPLGPERPLPLEEPGEHLAPVEPEEPLPPIAPAAPEEPLPPEPTEESETRERLDEIYPPAEPEEPAAPPEDNEPIPPPS